MNCRTFITAILMCFAALEADVSYWDVDLVRSYVHNSELQRRWAMSFLAPHLKNLKGDETILDVGCGDGKISADISKFVLDGLVLGIDLSPSMVAWSRRQYLLDYPNLSFLEGSFLTPNTDLTFDVIVSFCALQHSSDPIEALVAIKKRMKSKSKLLILVPAMHNKALNKARAIVAGRPRWVEYWKKYVPRKFLTADHYHQALLNMNFQNVKVETLHSMDPFVDREELLKWMEGTIAPVVPIEEARQFYNEWIDEYLKLDPEAINSDGVIFTKLGFIVIVAELQ